MQHLEIMLLRCFIFHNSMKIVEEGIVGFTNVDKLIEVTYLIDLENAIKCMKMRAIVVTRI